MVKYSSWENKGDKTYWEGLSDEVLWVIGVGERRQLIGIQMLDARSQKNDRVEIEVENERENRARLLVIGHWHRVLRKWIIRKWGYAHTSKETYLWIDWYIPARDEQGHKPCCKCQNCHFNPYQLVPGQVFGVLSIRRQRPNVPIDVDARCTKQ